MAETYKIVRYFRAYEKKPEVRMTGLTLEEARQHCTDPTTHNISQGWFDRYSKE